MRGGAISFGVSFLALYISLEAIGSNHFHEFGMNGF